VLRNTELWNQPIYNFWVFFASDAAVCWFKKASHLKTDIILAVMMGRPISLSISRPVCSLTAWRKKNPPVKLCSQEMTAEVGRHKWDQHAPKAQEATSQWLVRDISPGPKQKPTGTESWRLNGARTQMAAKKRTGRERERRKIVPLSIYQWSLNIIAWLIVTI